MYASYWSRGSNTYDSNHEITHNSTQLLVFNMIDLHCSFNFSPQEAI